MNFEKAWSVLLAAIAAQSDYHEIKKSEMALLMLRCLAEPDAVLRDIEKDRALQAAERLSRNEAKSAAISGR